MVKVSFWKWNSEWKYEKTYILLVCFFAILPWLLINAPGSMNFSIVTEWLFLHKKTCLLFFIIQLAPWTGKMNQIARCDWLPEWARWSHLARSGLPTVSRKQNFTKSHIIWPSLFGQDGWILASFFFCEFMDLNFVSVHKHAKKKELGQYPAILTSHLVNNPYTLSCKIYRIS